MTPIQWACMRCNSAPALTAAIEHVLRLLVLSVPMKLQSRIRPRMRRERVLCGRPSAMGDLSSGAVKVHVGLITEPPTESCSSGGCAMAMSNSGEKTFETCKA